MASWVGTEAGAVENHFSSCASSSFPVDSKKKRDEVALSNDENAL